MSTPVPNLIEKLQESKPLKVWSLIITFFGDAVEPRGGIVSAGTLQSVMEVMGVGSGAVRTACSRLATDGWIERQKQGRNSFYRLSDKRHRAFINSSQQIYAIPPAVANSQTTSDVSEPLEARAGTNFTLLMQNPLHTHSDFWQALRDKGICINANSILFDSEDAYFKHALHTRAEIKDMLILSNASASIPDWVKRSVCPDSSAQHYYRLMQRFQPIASALPTDPLSSLAVRCLLIHEWRRVLLRYTTLPAELVPADWPHTDCHRFVANLYQQLFEAGEHWMDANAIGPDGPLKTMNHNSRKRFTGNIYQRDQNSLTTSRTQ